MRLAEVAQTWFALRPKPMRKLSGSTTTVILSTSCTIGKRIIARTLYPKKFRAANELSFDQVNYCEPMSFWIVTKGLH